MSIHPPYWPHIESTDEAGITAVDMLGVVFFLERRVAAQPELLIRAFETYLAGIGRHPPLSYVDDEGDIFAMPDNPRPVLERQLVLPAQTGDDSVRMALADATQPPYRYYADCSYSINPEEELMPGERIPIYFRISQETLIATGAESVIAFALELTEFLPYSHAYISPVLTCEESFRTALPYLHRHPGLDIADVQSVAVDIGDHIVGPHWVNLLGPRLSQAAGGIDALRAALPQDIRVQPCGQGGLCVVVGELPDIGDLNLQNQLPLYRTLARVLQPLLASPKVTYFTDAEGMLDADAQASWHARFVR
jgi:hypothetical protein